MVVHQVNIYRLAAIEAENNAPVAGHAHAPLPAALPLESVQLPPGQVHVPWRPRILQRGQNTPDTLHMVGVEPAGIVSFVESPLPFVRETNTINVPCIVSRCQPIGPAAAILILEIRPGLVVQRPRNPFHWLTESQDENCRAAVRRLSPLPDIMSE